MKRLGYTRFVAQGGDWGNAVTEQMALLAASGIDRHSHQHACHRAGRHRQGALVRRARRRPASQPTRSTRTISSTSSTSTAWATPRRWRTARRRSTGSGIRRSAWPPGCSTTTRAVYALIARVFDGQREGLTRDDILDNVTLYWLTNTTVSSARLYWESKLAFFAPKDVAIPVAVSAFPDELYQAPRSWTERAYPKLIYYNKLDKGGHFAAWEQPQLFAAELRAAFKSLR